jgi:Cysteine-rich secretory protein family
MVHRQSRYFGYGKHVIGTAHSPKKLKEWVTGTREKGILKGGLLAAALAGMAATPAIAEWRLPCVIGVCLIIFESPEDAARPVQPLDPKAALAAVNAFRTKNGRGAVVLDARLTRAAAMQSETQAKRGLVGHDGPDGSLPKDRAVRAGYRAKIASENVASGQKSFSDVMRSWEESAGHRENLLRPKVTTIGVAMAKSSSGRPYWTLVLGAELK